jgi:hypothetical protein
MKPLNMKQLFVLIFISVSIISLFQLLKFKNNNLLSTYDEYYHVASINQIRASRYDINLLLKENIIYSLDFLLAFSDIPFFLMRVLPFLFNILNVVLIYLILNEFIDSDKQKYFTLIILILSPTFVFLHATYNMLFVALFFILLGSLFIINDLYLPSLVSFIVAFGLNPKLFFLIVVVLIIFFEKLRSKNIVLPIAGLLASTIIFMWVNISSFPNNISLHFLFTNYVSDFGALYGFGVFSFLLGLIGLILSWKDKKEQAVFYYSLLALLISSLYDLSFIIFIELMLTYYGGLAATKIWYSKWESPILKNYVLLLILCGIIFSSGSYINRLSKSGPEYREIISLEWMKNNIDNRKKIFSYYQYGFMLNAITGGQPYTDKRYYQYSNDKTKIVASDDIFKSRDLKKISNFLEKNNIGYVWINEKMKDMLVWNNEEEGLLFVMKNSAAFEKIYDYLGVEIWEYHIKN